MSTGDPFSDERRVSMESYSGIDGRHPSDFHPAIFYPEGADALAQLRRDAALLEVAALKQALIAKDQRIRHLRGELSMRADRLADLQETLTDSDAIITAFAGGCVVLAIGVVLAWRHR